MFKLVVLFSVLAFAAAKPSVVTYGYSGLPAVSSQSQYSVHRSVVPTVYNAYGLNYPSVVSTGYPVGLYAQPANSPAVVVDAVSGVPLDTPEVVAARAAHFQATALTGHHLAKRSLTPLSYSSVVPVSPYTQTVVGPSYGPSFGYSTPLVSAYSPYFTGYGPYATAAVVPKALSVHPY